MANTECDYLEMVNGIMKAAKKIEEEAPLPVPQSIAVDLAMTTMIVLIDIASSFNRIAKAMEHDRESRVPVENPDAKRKPFPTV